MDKLAVLVYREQKAPCTPDGKRKQADHADRMIRELLKSCLNLQAVLGHDSLGAPAVINCPDIRISKSYCSGWTVCAVSSGPVGIDAEPRHRPDPGLARRFYSPQEQACPEAWTALWTLKEAWGKYQGRGLAAVSAQRETARDCAEAGASVIRIALDDETECSVVSRAPQASIFTYCAEGGPAPGGIRSCV